VHLTSESFTAADCDTNHCLVVNKNLTDFIWRDSISRSFPALKDLDADVDINSA
jgi:hypothetical protein